MHDDRDLIEKRIARETWERLLPLVHADRVELTVEAGPSLEELQPFAVGTPWGPPWATTWFVLSGTVPISWAEAVAVRDDRRVEVLADLGFTLDPPGFQAEGMVVDRATGRPLHGLHPRRTHHVLAHPGTRPASEIDVVIEAASNPSFPQFVPSHQGDPATADARPLHVFRQADAVLIDIDAEALVHDVDVATGAMHALPTDDPHRTRLRSAIVAALDALPDVARARARLQDVLAVTGRGLHRIVATGHAHIDTAWLWPLRETVRKCTRTFSSAIELMELDPGHRFTCSQAQQYAWIEERHPELFAAITDKVDAGQWIPVGGMWVESDMNLPSGESLARQIVFGQRYFEEKFGVRCTEMWIPDVFGYPAGLPQLFAAGGMHRFITQKLSWNKQNRFPHHTFRWEGLDGTSVLTHFPPVDTYNAEITPGEVAHSNRRFLEHGWSAVSLMPFGHGDGGGGPAREMLERARRLASPLAGGVLDASVEIGTASDVFEVIEQEIAAGAPVPVWRGELYFETHRGTLTSQLRTKLGNRRCERLLVELERWSAMIGRPADADELWREVLTQQFHDILPGSSIAWVHDDAEAVFERVEHELACRISAALAELAPSAWSLANPGDSTVDGVVIVEAREPFEAADATAQHLADGEVALVASVEAGGLAPLGSSSRLPHPEPVVATPTSLHNGVVSARFTDDGELASLIDVAAARECVPPGRTSAMITLAPDHPVEYDAWDLESWTRDHATVLPGSTPQLVDAGPLVGRLRTTRRVGDTSIIVTHELRAGDRQLRVHVDLDWQHEEHLLSMSFPLDVRAERAACDVQFGVVERPTHASSPWDAAKFEVCAHRFVSVAEPSFGIAVLNDGRFGHHLFDDGVTLSLARGAKYPDPEADRGPHDRVTFAIRPHDGDLADVRDAASALQHPVRCVRGAAASTPEPLVRVDGRGVEIDAVKLADDGSGDLIVRLHEHVGDRTHLSVACAAAITEASRCDLLEVPSTGIEVGDGIVALSLRPFELVTLRLRR